MCSHRAEATMSDVYVVGTDMIRFGRFPGRTVEDLGAEAALLALADAGLGIRDMQAFYCGNLGQAGAGVGQRIMKQIGQTGVPVVNVANACATGATAFREGWIAIKAGLYDLVLCVGVEQMGKGMLGVPKAYGGLPIEGLLGSATMPASFATLGMEHVREHGTTFEQFAKVSVKNHHHSTMNAKAMYRFETPLEEVMNAEMIAYPLTKLMCSVNVDGAAAAVLCSEKKARELGLVSRAVRVRASVLTSDPYTPHNLANQDFNAVTRLAAQQAYDMAGLGPKDIDLIELHDCFATAELLHYENLGICADGEAGRLIDTGHTALGGQLPVNVSGGLLSKGHPLGATGIANIYEVTTHLREEAGDRQVQGARVGLTHVVGAGAACAIHVLEKL
jgi:acetyl-CoA acyltransferase